MSEQSRGASSPVKHHVLVVEDDADVRESLQEMLESHGYTVLTAGDGREALDVLARGPRPCVILLDLMMPVMSGWEVLATLRNDGALSTLPVVVVSAASNVGGPLTGARCCLSKPVPVDSLLRVVEEHCPPPAALP